MRTIGAATMVVLALSGVIASAASAKAVSVLTANFGPYLQPGAFIELEGVGVYGKTTSGTVECERKEHTGLVGTLLTNWEKTDKIEVKSARGIYYGAGTCQSTLPIGGQVKMYWFGGSSLGTLLIGTSEKVEYKANPANETEIEFYSAETEAFCTYGVKKLKGKREVYESAYKTYVYFDAKVALVGHYLATCPKKMELSTGFVLKYAPHPAEEEEQAIEDVLVLSRDSNEKP